jgi:hypothetical protein
MVHGLGLFVLGLEFRVFGLGFGISSFALEGLGLEVWARGLWFTF